MGDFFDDDRLQEEIVVTEAMCSEYELVFFRELPEKYNLQDNQECK